MSGKYGTEFLSAHRPKICIKHVWLTTDIWKGERITANLVCVNNGTTEATLNEAGIKFVVLRNANPNIPATLNVAGKQLPCGISG